MDTQYMAAANDSCLWPANAKLFTVNVGTTDTSAVVTVYNGTTSSGEVKAVIDAATAVRTCRFHGARFPNGLFVELTGGNAKVSVVAD